MHAADLKHSSPSLQEKLEYIYALRTGSKVNWDQGGYLHLLNRLNDPHLRLPLTVHVAGTNGKGSVIAMLFAMIRAAGHKVHVYTSPHLIRFNERIVLDGKEISDEQAESYLDRVLEVVEQDKLTLSFFEITTAAAFLAFSEHPADILLLETGMGGRLDCTNVIDKPAVTIISRISMDHTSFLGNTIEQIALEKAGIIKTGCPCILGDQHNARGVINVIESKALELNAPLFAAGESWHVSAINDEEMEFTIEDRQMILPLPALTGAHQLENAGAALAALYVLKDVLPVDESAMGQGLRRATWPGRMQRLAPALFNLPDRKTKDPPTEIWLDSAHNDSAGQALARQAEIWKEKDSLPLHMIVGMMDHKDAASFLTPLSGHIASLTFSCIPGVAASIHGNTLLQSVSEDFECPKIEIIEDPIEALKIVYTNMDGEGRILFAGSLYLSGYILRYTNDVTR